VVELCFNLWYYINKAQVINLISARAYLLAGSDEDKSVLLSSLSEHEYKLAIAEPPPLRLGEITGGGIHYSLLAEIGVEPIYENVFLRLQKSIPGAISFPEEKLFYATPLYDFGEGFVPAYVSDGFIKTR